MSESYPYLAGTFPFPESSHYGSARGVTLGDRITYKLGDALFLLDEGLEMTACESIPRVDGIVRSPLEHAREEINSIMKQLTN